MEIQKQVSTALHPSRAQLKIAGRRVRLRVWTDRLVLAGRRIHGAWDPTLRRVELFGCDASRSDQALVHTLAHELWHVLRWAEPRRLRAAAQRSKRDEIERRADAFAARAVACLGKSRVRECAAALRRLALPRELPGHIDRVPVQPFGVLS